MPPVDVEGTRIAVLSEEHRVEDFDCGDPTRNAWLCTRAFSNQRNDDTRTYVALRGDEVVGFHALTVGSILRAAVPGPLRRNAADPVSYVLLAQLAVASRHQRQGLSGELIRHAMGQAARIAEIAGCRLLAVHPGRPELVDYYRKFGFVPTETVPLLMAISMREVRRILVAVGDA
jgi:predicted N-acetyltransferase YhbS